MDTFEDTFEYCAVVIPLAFLIAGYAAFSRRSPMTRVWTSGVAALASLPVGTWLVELICYPPNFFGYEHDAGAGLGFVPLLLGWVLCAFVWATLAVITVVRSHWLKPSN